MTFNATNCPICKRNKDNYVENAYDHLWEHHELIRKLQKIIEDKK